MIEILAKFNNRNDWIEYTMEIFDLLVTDKNIECIINADTGEIIYLKD